MAAILGLAALAAVNAVPSIQAQSGTSQLMVTSQDTNGGTILGYYFILYQGGKQVGAGATPATFTLNNGQSYVIQADSFGNCFFDHWADTGGTSASREISISSAKQFTAVYDCSGSTYSSASIDSVDQNGNAIFGFYTVLYDSSGSVVGTGFTHKTFPATIGDSYSVLVDDYGDCTFSHWLTSGSTSDPLTFVETQSAKSNALSWTAVYDCGITNSSAGLTVVSSDFDTKGEMNGYYVVLYQGSNLVSSGFTPTTFALTTGQTYTIQADRYGGCIFYYWTDVPGQGTEAVYSNPVTFTAPGSDTSIQATYRCS
jgi:hypothetical protein